MPRSARPRRAWVARRGRRAARPALIALLAAALACIGPAAAASAAGPPGGVRALETPDPVDGAPASGTSEEEAEAEPQIVVAPNAPLLAPGDQEFSFTVLIRNPGEQPLPEGRVSLELGPERLTAADELQTDFADSGLPAASASAGETEAGGEQSLTITVPRADFPLRAASDPGVYRVRASFTPAAGGAAPDPAVRPGVTPVLWRAPASSGGVRVSLVVPFVLPSEVASMPTRQTLNDVAPRLLDLLDVAERERATLAVDPRIVAGIRAYGDNAPGPAVELLDRLESTAAPLFFLQFADADPAAQAAVGLDELLQPTDLGFVTRFGSFPEASDEGAGDTADEASAEGSGASENPDGGDASGDTADTEAVDGADGSADAAQSSSDADEPDGGAGSAEAAGDDDPAPDTPEAIGAPPLDEMLAWPETTPTAWPAAGEIDGATLDLLRSEEITDVVVDSANLTHEGGPLVSLEGLNAIVTDGDVDSALARGMAGATSAERAAGLAEAASLLSFSSGKTTPGVVVAFDRSAIADAENAAAMIEELASFAWLDPTPVAEQGSGSGSLRSGSALDSRRELLRAALGREEDVSELGALLTRPEYLSGYQRSRLLQLFSTRYAADESEFAAVAEKFRERDGELLEGVHVISTEHTQLLGASSRVPLQVHNALPFEAEVTGTVSPMSAAVSVSEREIAPTLVPPEGNQTVLVPVGARVSSGESGLIIELTDTDGARVFYSGAQPLTIRSAVEAIALGALGTLAALLLGFGIWRSVRRHRRQDRDEDAAGARPGTPAEAQDAEAQPEGISPA